MIIGLTSQHWPHTITGKIDKILNDRMLYTCIYVHKIWYDIMDILENYRGVCRDAPTLFGLDASLHASMIFFKMNKHSRNFEKNGWCDNKHNDVNEWLRTFVRRLVALGDDEWLPPDSESALGAVIPSRGGCWTDGCGPNWPGGSEPRRLGQSRSESLGAILLLWSLLIELIRN